MKKDIKALLKTLLYEQFPHLHKSAKNRDEGSRGRLYKYEEVYKEFDDLWQFGIIEYSKHNNVRDREWKEYLPEMVFLYKDGSLSFRDARDTYCTRGVVETEYWEKYIFTPRDVYKYYVKYDLLNFVKTHK